MNTMNYLFNSEGELIKRVHGLFSLMEKDNAVGNWVWNGSIWYEYRDILYSSYTREKGWYANPNPPNKCKAALLLIL